MFASEADVDPSLVFGRIGLAGAGGLRPGLNSTIQLCTRVEVVTAQLDVCVGMMAMLVRGEVMC